MSEKIHVAVLDHFQSNLDGYRFRLREEVDLEIVASEIYANKAETILSNQDIDVLLISANLPFSPKDERLYSLPEHMPGLLQRYKDLAILVIAIYPQDEFIDKVMKAGACGYICKDDSESVKALGSIIRSVVNGGCYLSQTARQSLFAKANSTTER